MQVGKLSAVLKAAEPASGLHSLQRNKSSLNGSLLGVTANSAPLATNSTNEFFVRGNDLVTNFAQTNEQPFSCQIYWRATLQNSGVILLDTIISVQTELLESFPQIAVETQLES
ncbi:MAG: hypothetical protein MI725_09355, partial [Pirellulales bacterium]|nr:hypothetical protein [Pirellulales bacterium]